MRLPMLTLSSKLCVVGAACLFLKDFGRHPEDLPTCALASEELFLS